jgi:hypothetical protein
VKQIGMFTLLLTASIAGAADFVPPEPVPPDVQLAAFRDLVEAKGEFVQCLVTNELDPPPEVLAQFRSSAVPVVRGSECATSHTTGAYRRSDRHPAEFIKLRDVHVFSDTQATIEYVRVRHGLCADNGQMSLRRQGPVWIVYARALGPIC